MHGANFRPRPKGVTRDPFDRLVDEVSRGGASTTPVWGQQRRHAFGMSERKFAKALREYWGESADPLRVKLATEDARFVAGVVHMVGDELHLSADDRRRVCAEAVRVRLLGEPDTSFADVDRAWRAWWPPAPGPEGRDRVQEFLRAWRVWLEDSRS